MLKRENGIVSPGTDVRKLAIGYVEDLLMYPVVSYEFENKDTVNKLQEFSIEQVRQSIIKCTQLTDEIKEKLYGISNEIGVDINTLVLVFEESVHKMKESISGGSNI